MSKPHFTRRERLAVVEEAIRLIRLPESFTQGEWKCPVWERDEFGREAYNDATGFFVQKTKKGRPVFAYCLEGAVNQAAINVLGPDRAEKLGANSGQCTVVNDQKVPGEYEPVHGAAFSDELSITSLAHELFGAVVEESYGYTNDWEPPNTLNDLDDPAIAHKRVLKVLREKARALKRELAT